MERLRGVGPDNNYNIVGNLLENLQKIRKSYPIRSIAVPNILSITSVCGIDLFINISSTSPE